MTLSRADLFPRLLAAGAVAGGVGMLWIALWLGVQHPVAPAAVLAGIWLAFLLCAWRPHAWLTVMPAVWPLLNFSPWTGWWLLDESDVLVLTVLAAGYGRWGLEVSCQGKGTPLPWTGRWLWVACLCSSLLSAGIGWRDAGMGWSLGGTSLQQALYADHGSAWNTVRLLKPWIWAALLWPLVQRALASGPEQAGVRWARGMVCGLALVCLVIVWERHTYAGLLNFSLPYRTSAWFWEMHVGGGALDMYLAVSVPFALWALWTAPTLPRWSLAALLVWAAVYAVLTTYSRGIYLATLIALSGMVLMAWRLALQPRCPGMRRTELLLVLALGLQGGLVLGGGVFMSGRLAEANRDLLSRWSHWQAGWSLLHTPADLGWGLGLGRLPAHYSTQVPSGEWAGRASWDPAPAGTGGSLHLSGPRTLDHLAPYFGLTQRVQLPVAGRYRVRLLAQPEFQPQALTAVVCRRHLLFAWPCQWTRLDIAPGEQGPAVWVEASLDLEPPLAGGAALRQPDLVFELQADLAGQSSRLLAVQLLDPQGRQLLRNPSFEAQLAHWMPAAMGQFQPWHMDNLYLEVLLERGWVGALVCAALGACVLSAVVDGCRRRCVLAWVWAGALVSVSALGWVISVMELPRLILILLVMTWLCPSMRGQTDEPRSL